MESNCDWASSKKVEFFCEFSAHREHKYLRLPFITTFVYPGIKKCGIVRLKVVIVLTLCMNGFGTQNKYQY